MFAALFIGLFTSEAKIKFEAQLGERGRGDVMMAFLIATLLLVLAKKETLRNTRNVCLYLSSRLRGIFQAPQRKVL